VELFYTFVTSVIWSFWFKGLFVLVFLWIVHFISSLVLVEDLFKIFESCRCWLRSKRKLLFFEVVQ
jgi:hypothetical protein